MYRPWPEYANVQERGTRLNFGCGFKKKINY